MRDRKRGKKQRKCKAGGGRALAGRRNEKLMVVKTEKNHGSKDKNKRVALVRGLKSKRSKKTNCVKNRGIHDVLEPCEETGGHPGQQKLANEPKHHKTINLENDLEELSTSQGNLGRLVKRTTREPGSKRHKAVGFKEV